MSPRRTRPLQPAPASEPLATARAYIDKARNHLGGAARALRSAVAVLERDAHPHVAHAAAAVAERVDEVALAVGTANVEAWFDRARARIGGGVVALGAVVSAAPAARRHRHPGHQPNADAGDDVPVRRIGDSRPRSGAPHESLQPAQPRLAPPPAANDRDTVLDIRIERLRARPPRSPVEIPTLPDPAQRPSPVPSPA